MADISNVNEQTPSTVEKTDRGFFDFMKKKPEAAETTLASEFDHKAQVSEPVYKKEDIELEKEKENEKKHGGLLEKLHRSDSSSSSSSDEEGDDEEKKKRRKERKEKKGLKDKLKEKLPGQKDHDDTSVPIEKYEEFVPLGPPSPQNVYSEPSHVQGGVGSEHEKKGVVDKIKDKVPDSHPKPAEEHHVPHVQQNVYSEPSHVQGGVGSEHEKKGFVDKIKDKLPGSHPKPAQDHHVSAATPVAADSYVAADGKEKKGFLDKIKDKIPGLTKSSDEKKEHEEHKKEGY